ncbi:MAG: hypothetical protein HY882_00085 [Deltaproteobacteria bacterium]|nr:hypothetical protein [Deltaproteobacteria bacterium]
MSHPKLKIWQLSARDLDFLVETVSPEVKNKERLKQIIREDEDFRNSFIGDEKVFRRLMDEEETFLKISPPLFFEILLRKAAHELEGVSYTVEKTSTMKIPIFDTKEVAELLNNEPLLLYLADMLSSFTRIESYTIPILIRKGIWEKIRFNDMDVLSLMSFCQMVDDEYRLGFYKRIADICLFILGIFPDYAERDYRYLFSGQVRPHIRGKLRISPQDYAEEGRKFYKLAAEHPAARELELSEIFWALHREFQKAKKPLNFIAEHYIQYRRYKFFG